MQRISVHFWKLGKSLFNSEWTWQHFNNTYLESMFGLIFGLQKRLLLCLLYSLDYTKLYETCKFFQSTVRGIKKRAILTSSIFMSFSPIDFIFIGWIGYEIYFCWALINFDFKPANEIFSKKCNMSFFQKVCFLGVWHRKLTLSKIGVMDVSYIMDSGQNRLYTTFPNFFSLI